MSQTQQNTGNTTQQTKDDEISKPLSQLNLNENIGNQQKIEENKSQDINKNPNTIINNNNNNNPSNFVTENTKNMDNTVKVTNVVNNPSDSNATNNNNNSQITSAVVQPPNPVQSPSMITPQQPQQQTNAQPIMKEDEKTSEPESTRNLIINFLPPDMKEPELEQLFSKFGSVEQCKIVIDLNTKKSRGYGFVKFYKSVDANNAIQQLNGFKVRNKLLKVAMARPKSKDIQNSNIYITNIPFQYSVEDLKKHFVQFGNIVECRILKDPSNGKPRGVGFVRMDTHHHAINALHKLEGTTKFRMKLAQRYAYMQNNNNNRQGQQFASNYNQGGFNNNNPNQNFNNMQNNFGQFGGTFGNPGFNNYHGNNNLSSFNAFPNNNRNTFYQRNPNMNSNYNQNYGQSNGNYGGGYGGPGAPTNNQRRRSKPRKYYSKKQNN